VDEALRAYTRNAAYAEFQDRDKGILAKGMLADFVIIDRDLTKVPPETIRDARIMLTVVDGKPVFERAELAHR
jgi:predicted amidohydrolase YtcJ